ncbi:MAG: hypothetical protein IJG45_00790 [Oscillospiraceae bacterium]|nr:hypothetical protein [Oscillospiraceae bacterium]
MDSKKTKLSTQAQIAVQKATEALNAAKDALNEANATLESIRELDPNELEQVVGGTSEWEENPTVEEHDYPVFPNP